MAKIYRPTYRKCVGGKWITKATAKWYGRIKIGGRWKAVPLTTDKRASEIMLADMLRNEAMGKVGAVDPFAAPSRVPFTQHVEDWQAALRFNDAGEKHVIAAGKLVTRFLDAAGLCYPPDANPDAVTRFLIDHKATGVGPRTVNWTAATLRAFFAWMVREKRLATSPVVGVPRLNERADVRRDRRPLVGYEPERLVSAADASAWTFRGMRGPDRGTLYVVAMGTGFRVTELAALTAGSFDLDAVPPVVRLAADQTKNGQPVQQPLPAFAVKRLRDFTGPSKVLLFPGTWHERAAQMLRHDLDAAGIPVEVGGRVADFHSLRHTFVANLRRSGVELGDAMKLARHSDPKLTLAIYGQTDLGGLAASVDRLSALHGLDTTIGTNLNEPERLCAAGGDAAHRYNAPDDAGILAFSADVEGNTPGAVRTRNLPLRRRQAEPGDSPTISSEDTDPDTGGLTRACESSDFRLALAALRRLSPGDRLRVCALAGSEAA